PRARTAAGGLGGGECSAVRVLPGGPVDDGRRAPARGAPARSRHGARADDGEPLSLRNVPADRAGDPARQRPGGRVTRDLDRRSFLSVGAAVVGGSFLAWSGAACAPRGEGRPPLAVDMDAVLTMHADGSVVVHVPVPEIGQGVNTALSMLIAEELGIPWDSVRVVPASFGEDMGPRPFAGG